MRQVLCNANYLCRYIPIFEFIFKFSLIFMNMQKDNFHIGSLDERVCQIVSLMITKRKNCGLMMVWG